LVLACNCAGDLGENNSFRCQRGSAIQQFIAIYRSKFVGVADWVGAAFVLSFAEKDSCYTPEN